MHTHTEAFIVDSGPFSCKVGWPRNKFPKSEIGHMWNQSFLLKEQEKTVSLISTNRSDLIILQFSYLDVTNMESQWYTAICDYNRWDDSLDAPVFLFDSRLLPDEKTIAAEFFFEVLGAASLHMPPEGLIYTATLRRLQFNSVLHNSSSSSVLTTPWDASTSSVHLPSPFTGLLINVGYETTRLFSCLSGYATSDASAIFPVGGRIPAQLIFAHLHKELLNVANKSTPEVSTQSFPSSNPLPVSSPLKHHNCCSKLCRQLFEKMCFVSTHPHVDLFEIHTQYGRVESVFDYPSISPLESIASVYPNWHCCPLKSMTKRTRCVNTSQLSMSWSSEDGEEQLRRKQQALSLLHQHQEGTEHQPKAPRHEEKPSRGFLSNLGRLRLCRESKSADLTNSARPHQDLSQPQLQSSAALRSEEPPNHHCCICSLRRFEKAPSQLQLKNHHDRDIGHEMRSKRSRYPKYSNLHSDPTEMMSREHLHYILSNNSENDNLVRKAIHEMIFMAPEVFFSPAYVAANLGSSNIRGMSDLQTQRGLADIILSIFNECPIDCKKQMYSNIVLLGGPAMLPSFNSRLLAEIKNALECYFQQMSVSSSLSLDRISLRILTPTKVEEAKYSTWIGLRELWLHQDDLSSFSISKSEFEERGGFKREHL